MSGAEAVRPVVSVVVPVKDGGPLVRRLVQSLLSQTLGAGAPPGTAPAVEIICVDNGSTDDGFAALADLPIVRLEEPRPGAPAARNAGARAARADILAFVDQDCVAERRWLERLTAPFSDSDVVAAAGETMTGPGEGAVPRYLARIRQNSAEESLRRPVFPFAPLNNLAVRRSLFDRLGGFDESLPITDDVDFSLRIIRGTGATIHFVPNALVLHEPRRTTGALFRQYRKYGRGWADLLWKHPGELRWTFERAARANLDVLAAALRVPAALLFRRADAEFRRLDFVRRLGHRVGFVARAAERGRWFW